MDFQTGSTYYILPRCYDTVASVQFWNVKKSRIWNMLQSSRKYLFFHFLFYSFWTNLKKRGHKKQWLPGASLPLLALSCWRLSWPDSTDHSPWAPTPCCYQTWSYQVPLLKVEQKKLEGIEWVCKKPGHFPRPKLAHGVCPGLSKKRDDTTNGTHKHARKVYCITNII